MILLVTLLIEIGANQYWGELIRHDLFQRDRSSLYNRNDVTVKYDPNVLPIGIDDFVQITNTTFSGLAMFAHEKCKSYVKHMRSEYGNQYYANQNRQIIVDHHSPRMLEEDYMYNYMYNDYYNEYMLQAPTVIPKYNSATCGTIDYALELGYNEYEYPWSELLDVGTSLLNEMEEIVDCYPERKNPFQCERYVKVKLTKMQREMKQNDATSVPDFTALFYGEQVNTGPTEADFTQFHDFEERGGYTYNPVAVDTVFQIQSINDINLNGEYMDATVAISMVWTDERLKWISSDYGEVCYFFHLRYWILMLTTIR